MSGGGGRGREGRRVDKQEVSCLEIPVTTEGHLHPKPRLTGRITKNQNRLIYQWRTSNHCLTLYLKPSSGTMSTNKMYLAQGMRPDRLILQCGNILLEKHGKRRVRKRKKKKTQLNRRPNILNLHVVLLSSYLPGLVIIISVPISQKVFQSSGSSRVSLMLPWT